MNFGKTARYFIDQTDDATYELWCEWQPTAGKLKYDYVCHGSYEYCKQFLEGLEA